MPLHHLTVYEPPFPKVRLGKANDGGYVIADLPEKEPYDLFITGGLGTDSSFEKAFMTKYPTVKAYGFDRSLKDIPSPNFTHVPKFIGKITDGKYEIVPPYFGNASNIFMKMDVEGGEVDLFQTMTKEHLQRIAQLVIEIHTHKEVNIPRRLAETHWLVHLHPNNVRPTIKEGDLKLPQIYECTYLRKDKAVCMFNTRPIPDPKIDQNNVTRNGTVGLSGPPFVFPLSNAPAPATPAK